MGTTMIKKLLRKFLQWIQRDNIEDKPYDTSMSTNSVKLGRQPRGELQTIDALNFSVWSATGGKVIQLSSYDPRTDRYNNSLYIVTDQENLGEELAHIITREALSR